LDGGRTISNYPSGVFFSMIAVAYKLKLNNLVVKPHQALDGKTPAQNTGGLEIKGWKEFLQNALHKSTH
jgi:hypothetical protein